MPVSCECCVFSGEGPCDGLITRPGESYSVNMCLCVCVCVNECDQVQQKSSLPTMSR